MSSLSSIARGYDTDKAHHAHYLVNYERHLGAMRDDEVRLLELGVHRGGSLMLWRDYFHRGTIVGVDLSPPALTDPSGRVYTYRGAQDDLRLLDRIASERAPNGFDVIIDDCAHVGVIARASFWHLFEHHLRPGGVYVIEDWGTGYWDSWVDGVGHRARSSRSHAPELWLMRAIRRLRLVKGTRLVPGLDRSLRQIKRALMSGQFQPHDAGMVGFIKELVDECGAADITKVGWGSGTPRSSRIAEMTVALGHVFVRKA